jgi:hypothetical protein
MGLTDTTLAVIGNRSTETALLPGFMAAGRPDEIIIFDLLQTEPKIVIGKKTME